MSELMFNLKDMLGVQVFITPRITITIGKEVKQVPANIALQVAYVVKALVAGESASFGDKTKAAAGALILEAVKALPIDSTMTLYMPTKAESRDSADLKDWTSCVTVKTSDMLETAEGLNMCHAVLGQAEADINTFANNRLAKVGKYTVTQPVYYTLKAGEVTKTRGGTKVITSLF